MLYTCQYCNVEFNACPTNRRYKNIFCSSDCSSKFRNTSVTKNCKICNKEFSTIFSKSVTHIYCSKKCANVIKILRKQLKCGYCNKDIEVMKSRLKKVNFCSRTCVAKYYKLGHGVGVKRSQAEAYLSSLIKNDFKDILLMENTRSILSCGLEIDLFMPTCNLAIELNGPCHYFNIHGDNVLKKTQCRDAMKQSEIQQKGYQFIILDICHIKSKKKMNEFMNFQYENNIKPIITQSIPPV